MEVAMDKNNDSFTHALATVWRYFCAILLIGFLVFMAIAFLGGFG